MSSAPAESARQPALVFIFITLFLDILGIGLIVPILPKLVEQFSGGSIASASHTRAIIPRLGERRSVTVGLTISAAGIIAYGLATEGWMAYVVIAAASLSGISGPAVQGLISGSVGADEQGAVQGSLTSLASVAGVLGPPLATGLFGFFISAGAPVKLPGAAFFFSSALTIAAMLLAVRSFRREPLQPRVPVAPELRADSGGG